MGDSSKSDSKLSPEFRARLLKESQRPWQGLRRTIWLLFFASSFLGILIMGAKIISGESVPLEDSGIQLTALLIFGSLIYLDRNKVDK